MDHKGRAPQVCPTKHGPRAITAYIAARRHMERNLRFDILTLQALGANGREYGDNPTVILPARTMRQDTIDTNQGRRGR